MIKVLEAAIDKIKTLPADRQAVAAEVLEEIVAAGTGSFTVPDDHRAGVLEGLAQAERGELVSDAEMDGFWKSCGL